ncbi:tetratricopeptide repeat protein [Limnoglobus roseus]|uniref:Tetratricopeptide repeat protein n=1 Tax=Limnoglobus roseus TaxID=2598579 RepID=A0A5C1AEJ1_9BACT|nr:hypothetical protein [Limnoglobus roseus]QEL15448.1 hypothetical protein PX52LOC_02367 [Limnoglobus roseus]
MARWLVLVCLATAGCVTLGPPAPAPVVPEAGEAVDHLAMAADALAEGEERKATVYLSAHLSDHPDEAMTRAQLAELLFRQQRPVEARAEFEQFVATAQPMTGVPQKHLLHAHTRLMLIAQDEHDAYAEQLHRGIGLLTLVKGWDADATRRDEAAANETLAKAVKALRAARAEKSGDARANLYLVMAYTRMGQPSAARAARVCFDAAVPMGLTAWEQSQAADARP